VTPPTSSGKVNVYYLEHADATEVAKVLEGVVRGRCRAGPAGGVPAQQSPSKGEDHHHPDKPTKLPGDHGFPTDYQSLLQVIQRLDKRRRQVFVEATIAEVSLTKLKELGIQWSFFGGASKAPSRVPATTTLQCLSSFVSLLQSRLRPGFSARQGEAGEFGQFRRNPEGLDSTGTVNILSTPNILTSDNKEARFSSARTCRSGQGRHLQHTNPRSSRGPQGHRHHPRSPLHQRG